MSDSNERVATSSRGRGAPSHRVRALALGWTLALAQAHEAARVFALAQALAAVLAVVFHSTAVEAGCAVPGPELWSPSSAGQAPLGARVVVSLGGFGGLVRELELRPLGGDALIVRRRELGGPIGHSLVELDPEAPLQPATTYEVVARRPAGWHPNEWVFGAFTTGAFPTGRASSAPQPELRVVEHRYLERADARQPRRWIELALAPRSIADSSSLVAVWLPDERGHLALDAAPSVHLPREDRLRISSPEPCGGLHVPLPTQRRAEIAIAALDALGHRSVPVRLSIDFARPERHSGE